MIRLTSLLLLLLAGTGIASAQQSDSTERRTYIDVIQLETSDPMYGPANVITINPLKFFLMYNINYYRRLSNLIVIGGGLQTPAISALGGWGAQFETRIHPGRMALRGFYLAPNISYNRFTADETDASATAFSVGILGGWQWLPSDEFAIGLGIGYDHYFVSIDDDAQTDVFARFDGGVPAFRFDIGYAF